jgi:hypothetical protein
MGKWTPGFILAIINGSLFCGVNKGKQAGYPGTETGALAHEGSDQWHVIPSRPG